MSFVKPAALFVCVALAGLAGNSVNALAEDGARPVAGEEKAARTEGVKPASSEPKAQGSAEQAAKPAEKAAQKSQQAVKKGAHKPAHATKTAAKKDGHKPSAHATKGEPKKRGHEPRPAASKPAPADVKPETKKTEPAPQAQPEPKAEPAGKAGDDKAKALSEAEAKKRGWWPFGADKGAKTADKPADKGADGKGVDNKAPAAPAEAAKPEVKKPEPKPVSKAWLDDNEKRLKTAVVGSKFEVERRGDLLVVVAPADAAFNRDRPNMLLPASLGPLSKLAKQLEGDPQSGVLVLGHGDGNAEADRKLTQERAQAVAAIFRMSGLKSDRLMLRGMGAEQPLASNDNAKGRAQNRRVEVILTPRDNLPALMARNSH